MMVDDDRLPLQQMRKLSSRKSDSLWDVILTGSIESEADDLSGIVLELLNVRTSERQGRTIDTDRMPQWK